MRGQRCAGPSRRAGSSVRDAGADSLACARHFGLIALSIAVVASYLAGVRWIERRQPSEYLSAQVPRSSRRVAAVDVRCL